MAGIAGLVMHKIRLGRDEIRIWFAGLAGTVTYCILYVAKNIISGHFIKGFTWDVAIIETVTTKVPVTLVNGVIAVICACALALAMRPALRKAHVLG